MDIEFYCKDARENFLEPNSVDLFITHPPFLNRIPDAHGGDPNLQIQNADTPEDFSKALVECLKAMEIALKDSGAILLILPNIRVFFKIIKDILQDTSLVIRRDIVWNFEKSKIVNGVISGNEINHILYMTKNEDTVHPVNKLSSFVIEEDWSVYYVDEVSFFDALPKKMIENLIKVFSNEGDTVADLLAGTGTVALCSLENNRKAIYNDVSSLQVDLAKKRIYDTIESDRKGQK
jgi:DNA modification methylase